MIKFEMMLSAYLGVNPGKLIDKIEKYTNIGKTLPLVIGDKTYGAYRWTITRYDVQVMNTDGRGNILTAKVKIDLQEYLKS